MHALRETHNAAARRRSEREATPDMLSAWAAAAGGGRVTSFVQISGGNRCHSYAVDLETPSGRRRELYLRYQPPRPPSAEPYTVWREAAIYTALKDRDVPAPRLLAVAQDFQAILTERVAGRAEFRRLADEEARRRITGEFVAALAALHALPLGELPLAELAPGRTIAECVAREREIWGGMYRETGRSDPLIDFALAWLDRHRPDPQDPPVLVHGDAGPGNFLFDKGHLTALLDWELAHPGDPMEDLAWFSMRSVMEPVPDFAGAIREYGRLTGKAPDLARIRYHRVFVSTRVVIIRHRNVTGEAGNSIVSRALNRRLLVDAIADAEGVALPPPPDFDAPATAQTALYNVVLDNLRDDVAAVRDPRVVAAAKNAAKVTKYLREVDRVGALVEARMREALRALLGEEVTTIAAGEAALVEALAAGRVAFTDALNFFALSVACDAALASSASGGLATRGFPALPTE